MFFARSILLTTLLGATPVLAAPNQVIRMCLDDKPSFYFYNSVGTEKSATPGLVFDLIDYLQKKLAVEIRVMRRPKHACSVLIDKGEVDAIGLLSHAPEREKLGYFPLKNHQPDPDRAVIRTSYFLYFPKEKPIVWDGKSLHSLQGKRLGAIEGFSIIADLEQEGGLKVETFKSLDGMITRLQKGDIDGIAVNNDMVNRLSQRMALQKHDKPLKTKDYFIMVSRFFREKYPALPDALWKESALFVKSAEGQAAIAKYEKLENFP